MLTATDLDELTAFRRHLHRHPDLSGDEGWTAAAIRAALAPLGPARLVAGLGGHGMAAVFAGAAPGPTLMFRSELDALPIEDAGPAAHRSARPGKGHLCGHDGHSTILLGLARLMSRRPPARGRVVLMFQPAEEDGSGAAAVLADPGFAALAPDMGFALHNMPGLPLGHAAVQAGPVACASEGLRLVLTGAVAHASTPEQGRSPARALAALIPAAMALGPGGALDAGFRLVTVTHARLGEPAFGIAPGRAELWLTLRTLRDADMAALRAAVLAQAGAEAARHGLELAQSRHDAFAACTNDPAPVAALDAALRALAVPRAEGVLPMRPSEDFGRFGAVAPVALMLIGAGADHPPLHGPGYDFPDALIAPSVALFERVVRDALGG